MKRKITLSDDILFGQAQSKKPMDDNPLMEKAAVLGKFTMSDVNNWVNQTPSEELLIELNSNSKIIGQKNNDAVKVLIEPTRIKYLEKILTRSDVNAQLQELEQVKGLDDDALFTIKFLKRETKPLAEQSLKELSQSLKISRWLEQLNLDYPKPSEVYSEMKRKEFLKPLQEITLNFEGRVEELDKLKKYVDWLPREGWFEKATGFLKDINPWKNNKPMLITGIGGIGKSSLVSQFIMLHIQDSNQLPFIYIDFDNSSYSISEPLFVLLEAFNQLKVQFPNLENAFEGLIEILHVLVFNERRIFSKEKSNDSFRQMVYSKLLERLSQTEFELGMIDRPILAVFDSFEELQYRGANKTEFHTFLETIQEICELIPRIRPVFVGRAEIEFKEVEFKTIKLTSFDQLSADAYLKKLDIQNESLRQKIYQNFNGNPLTLQLAASLAKQEGLASAKRISVDRLAQLFKNLDEATVQKELVTRNLDHIHNADVRKIAMPGLLVRKVNEKVIQNILAEPCGLGKISLKKATEIYELLKKETFLIQANRHSDGIVFRPELRKAMEEMVWKLNPENANAIHDNAIRFYGNKSNPEDQAENIYHRLKIGEDPSFLNSKEYNKISAFLDRSLNELPLNAQIHIAGLRGSKFSEEKLKEAKLDDWEEYYVKVIQDGLKGSFHNLESILKEIKIRKERSFNSILYYWEARLYQRLNKIKKSDQILEKAIKEKFAISGLEAEEMLIRLKIVQIENREYEFDFEEAYNLWEELTDELLEFFDPFIAFQVEVLQTRLEARLKTWTINSEQPEIEKLNIDFEKNDTYKVYESYYDVGQYDNNFPFNTLPRKLYLEEFKSFKSKFSNDRALGDFTNKYLGNFLTGLSEPGHLDILVKEVFNRTNKNIIDQLNALDLNEDTPILVLANLYPSIEAAKRILQSAEIYTRHFSWKHSAIRNWEMIYSHLENSNAELSFLKTVMNEYPKNSELRGHVQRIEQSQIKLPVNKNIINHLSRIYPTIESSRLMLNFVGIKSESIAFDKNPEGNWINIITELNKRDELNLFFQSVVEQSSDEEFKNDIENETGITLLSGVSEFYQEEISFDKDELKKLVIKGKIEDAISKLASISSGLSNGFQNSVIMLQARFNSLERERNHGLIGHQVYSLNKNKITQTLINLIDDIEEENEIKTLTRTLKNPSKIGSSSLKVPSKKSFEKILNKNENLVSIDWLNKAVDVSKIVCMVETANGVRGTGVLIEGGFLLTSSHLVCNNFRFQKPNCKEACENGTCAEKLSLTLNYENDIGSIKYNLDPSHTFITNTLLDYTLIKIKDNPEHPLKKWSHAEFPSENTLPVINDLVTVIQHPQGGVKKIALPDNIISVWEAKQAIFYQANTSPGSSGAPVFNKDWKMIAIHQGGSNKSLGAIEINENGDKQLAKKGILIWPILEDIRSRGIDI